MKGLGRDVRFWLATSGILLLILLATFRFQIAGQGCWIPFAPHEIPAEAKAFSPPSTVIQDLDTGEERVHKLGTDQLGRDVASRLVHGTTIALTVGIWSSLLSLFIAFLLGGLAGYVGDEKHRLSWLSIIVLLMGFLLVHFYGYEGSYVYEISPRLIWSLPSFLFRSMVGIAIILFSVWVIEKFTKMGKVHIPWDTLVIKLMEVFMSMPRLFLLLAVFAIISKPSVLAVTIIIGCLRWPRLTRVVRAEVLSAKQESYVDSAKVMGLTDLSIYAKHILPNIYKPMLILTMLNIGTAILIESSLSFLHIGLPLTEVSWGRMLSDARDYIPAWWLAVGPGVMIFIAIISFNTISQRLSHHFESK